MVPAIQTVVANSDTSSPTQMMSTKYATPCRFCGNNVMMMMMMMMMMMLMMMKRKKRRRRKKATNK